MVYWKPEHSYVPAIRQRRAFNECRGFRICRSWLSLAQENRGLLVVFVRNLPGRSECAMVISQLNAFNWSGTWQRTTKSGEFSWSYVQSEARPLRPHSGKTWSSFFPFADIQLRLLPPSIGCRMDLESFPARACGVVGVVLKGDAGLEAWKTVDICNFPRPSRQP